MVKFIVASNWLVTFFDVIICAATFTSYNFVHQENTEKITPIVIHNSLIILYASPITLLLIVIGITQYSKNQINRIIKSYINLVVNKAKNQHILNGRFSGISGNDYIAATLL